MSWRSSLCEMNLDIYMVNDKGLTFYIFEANRWLMWHIMGTLEGLDMDFLGPHAMWGLLACCIILIHGIGKDLA